jgi:pimeloyl-ACP methyl ester carboxylesterase
MRRKGFAVYLPDLRNHGQSPHDEVFTLDAMASDLLTFFESEHLEQAALAGIRWGKSSYVFCLHSPGESF